MVSRLFVLVCMFMILTSCTSVNKRLAEKSETVEYYRIFDIKTKADRFTVAKAAMEGLTKNVGSAKQEMPIPSFSEPPEKPGRFKIVNTLEGTKIATLLAAQGSALQLKTALCPDAVWIGRAVKEVEDWWTLKLTACLFQYKDGYHLDMYAIFTKHSGGINIAKALGKAIASKAVGSPEEWVEKVFADIVRTIYEKTQAEITFVEGYPPVTGTPWLDKGDSVYKKQQ